MGGFAKPIGGVFNPGSLSVNAGFTEVELISGSLSPYGQNNGSANQTRFHHPFSVVSDGVFLYVADTMNHVIRKVDLNTNMVSDFVGMSGVPGSRNGVGLEAQFNGPTGMAVHDDFLYISDTNNCVIRRVNLLSRQVDIFSGAVLYDGKPLCEAARDGSSSNARFYFPYGLTNDGAFLYVADSANHGIRKISLANGSVTTLLRGGDYALYNQPTATDGALSVARTRFPIGVELVQKFDTHNQVIEKKLYFTESDSTDRLRMIDMMNPTSITVTTVAGHIPNSGPGTTSGFVNGDGGAARFHRPTAILAVGDDLYISDTSNNAIRKVTIANGIYSVSTLVGRPGVSGLIDGSFSSAQLYRPGGMTLLNGAIYFTDIGHHAIRKVDLVRQELVTVAGGRGGSQ